MMSLTSPAVMYCTLASDIMDPDVESELISNRDASSQTEHIKPQGFLNLSFSPSLTRGRGAITRVAAAAQGPFAAARLPSVEQEKPTTVRLPVYSVHAVDILRLSTRMLRSPGRVGIK